MESLDKKNLPAEEKLTRGLNFGHINFLIVLLCGCSALTVGIIEVQLQIKITFVFAAECIAVVSVSPMTELQEQQQ